MAVSRSCDMLIIFLLRAPDLMMRGGSISRGSLQETAEKVLDISYPASSLLDVIVSGRLPSLYGP
jgi:hypothetical protein